MPILRYKNKEVEVITGATSLALNPDDYVEGTVWTTCTLWHWVYSGIDSVIRQITMESLSDEALLNWLARDELIYKKLAMQEIMRRKDYQLQTLEKVFRQCQVDDCVHSLMYK